MTMWKINNRFGGVAVRKMEATASEAENSLDVPQFQLRCRPGVTPC